MKKTKMVRLLVSAYLITTGFNTIDWMMWSFRWQRYWLTVDFWDMGPFKLNQWWAYAVFGMLPLIAGCLLLGYTLRDIKVETWSRGKRLWRG